MDKLIIYLTTGVILGLMTLWAAWSSGKKAGAFALALAVVFLWPISAIYGILEFMHKVRSLK